MLDDARLQPAGLEARGLAVLVLRLDRDPLAALDVGEEPGTERQPSSRAPSRGARDHRVDQRRAPRLAVVHHEERREMPTCGAARPMPTWCVHGLDHVGDDAPDLRRHLATGAPSAAGRDRRRADRELPLASPSGPSRGVRPGPSLFLPHRARASPLEEGRERGDSARQLAGPLTTSATRRARRAAGRRGAAGRRSAPRCRAGLAAHSAISAWRRPPSCRAPRRGRGAGTAGSPARSGTAAPA